jgi:ribosomal protein L40E
MDERNATVALTTCKECTAPISTKATACPKCGAPQPKRPDYAAAWVIGGTLAALFVLNTAGIGVDKPAPPAPKPAAPSPEQVAATAKGDREINTVLAGARWLKESMKKPETFELLSASMIDGKVICYEYRARNSFNDRTRGVRVISDTVNSEKASDWNRLCAGKAGTDYSSVRSVLD